MKKAGKKRVKRPPGITTPVVALNQDTVEAILRRLKLCERRISFLERSGVR